VFTTWQRDPSDALTSPLLTVAMAEERWMLDVHEPLLGEDDPAVHGPRLALFDLDRTLVPGSSALALARALVANGAIKRRELLGAAFRDARFRRRGASDLTADRLKAKVLRVMRDRDRVPIVEIAGTVAAELVATMTPAARSLVDRHLDAGDFTVVLSASPQELVDAVVASLGAHRGVGTRAEHADGRFTGQLAGPFCYGASKLIRLGMELGAVELQHAWAYADSASDLPVLRAAGHPVAVNPDRRLAQVARAERWPVVRC
jgi:HAD superfamily hydrolase (TIGR01490 family)